MAIPAGTYVEGNRLITGDEAGTCVLTAVYRDGALTLTASAEVVVLEPVPVYEGPYTVEPKDYIQELETEDRRMIDDVTVLGIPFSAEENAGGGNTVRIGGADDGAV